MAGEQNPPDLLYRATGNNGQSLPSEFLNAWEPTLFDGLEGGDLELAQFFVPPNVPISQDTFSQTQ